MDESIDLLKEKYLNASLEVSGRLAQAGYDMEKPAYTITWGQIGKELSHVLVDQGIEPNDVTDEALIDLIEEVKASLYSEGILRWREMIRLRLTTLDSLFSESQEPDEGVLDEGVFTEQYENAIRLMDEEGYWVDGGASADFFDDW